MKRLITKADRLAVQQSQFDSLLKQNYTQETYKGLNIFVQQESGKKPVMKIFRDTCSEAKSFYVYQNMDQLEQAKQRAKDSYDRVEVWKAERKANTTISTAANCAKAIREELKNAFPDIKFSVRSDNFSGGDSVRIEWTDGPATSNVEDITRKYQYGHFDGMTDMYENSNSRDDIPQSKFVSAHRNRSAHVSEAVLPALKAFYDETETSSFEIENMLYRIFNKQSFPADAVFTGIARTDRTAGLTEDMYRITYTSDKESTEQPEKAVKIENVKVPEGEVQIIEYSQKAIAVIGDTKPIKEKLAQLGGKFNKYLSCGPGWIFSKKKLDILKTQFA